MEISEAINSIPIRHGVKTPAHTQTVACILGFAPQVFANFEPELAFLDFEIEFVTFGVVLEVRGVPLGTIAGALK